MVECKSFEFEWLEATSGNCEEALPLQTPVNRPTPRKIAAAGKNVIIGRYDAAKAAAVTPVTTAARTLKLFAEEVLFISNSFLALLTEELSSNMIIDSKQDSDRTARSACNWEICMVSSISQ